MKINGLIMGTKDHNVCLNCFIDNFDINDNFSLSLNSRFGFSDECNARLGEDPNDDDSVFNRVNRLFEYLPLATVIEDKIICLHGGIGSSLHYISEIENLPRPLEVIHEVNTPEQQLVVDILWSDPTESDQELGILPNVIRDPAGTGNIVKFGPDRVNQFLV